MNLVKQGGRDVLFSVLKQRFSIPIRESAEFALERDTSSLLLRASAFALGFASLEIRVR
jgi:hypothetical protein